jgi:hypothetical protein
LNKDDFFYFAQFPLSFGWFMKVAVSIVNNAPPPVKIERSASRSGSCTGRS